MLLQGGKVVFSTLLATCMARLMQLLAAAVPGSLDPLRGQSASAQSRHWGRHWWPHCAWHWVLSHHSGIKLTACVTVVSHVQSLLKQFTG